MNLKCFLIKTRSKCSNNIKAVRHKMVVQYASKFPREKRVIFNNFRYSVRFLDSHEMLVYIIDSLSNSNGIAQCSPVKYRL